MKNTELFAPVAREYADYRPGYPPELFEWLARASAVHDAAWDCGCGSGQATIALAAHFGRVFATDVSREQIAAAPLHPRVTYSVAAAEASGLPAASVDLVTVAQALHWFDVGAFHSEVRRVARPGAMLAAWTYPRPRFVDAALDRIFDDFHGNVVGPCWPPERRHVEARYSSLPSPPVRHFEALATPEFCLELRWPLEQVIGYVSSWSATARYRRQNGADPVPRLREALNAVWPAPGEPAALRMPLVLLAWRVR